MWESSAGSGTAVALGLVCSWYKQTNVDKITASVPTGLVGREIDLAPVLDFCALYAYRGAKMVDHSDFFFDVVPPDSGLDEVADAEPATEQLFSRALIMSPVATQGEASTSSARAALSS